MTASTADPDVLLVVEQLRRSVPGGIGTYASGLLGGLDDVDEPLAIELLASRAPGEKDPLAAYGYPVRAMSLPGPLLTRLWDRGWWAPRTRAGVVHATSLAFPSRLRRPESAGPSGVRRASLMAVTVHDLSWRHHPEATTPRGRRWHETRLLQAIKMADAMIVPSLAVADDLSSEAVVPGLVHIIPHGADHLPAPDLDGAVSLLARHGVRGPYLLSVGTLEPRKNLVRLVDAYTAARPSLPEPWPLVMVGPSGWGTSDGTGQGAGAPHGDGAVGVGQVTDAVLAGLYAGARLLAYTPLMEGYGLPPIEAMGFGTPVVASTTVPSVHTMPADASSLADRIGPAAVVVDPFDVDAIAAALVRVGTDEDLRQQLTSAGRALAGARTWRRCALGHIALWQSLR